MRVPERNATRRGTDRNVCARKRTDGRCTTGGDPASNYAIAETLDMKYQCAASLGPVHLS